jgi:zinc protease
MGLLAPLALLCLACTPLDSLTPTSRSMTEPQRDPNVVQGELDNGLRYRLVPTGEQPGRLDIRLRVDAGSVDETDDEVGVAHLLEHLAFYNRDDKGRTVRQRLQQAGWQQGRHFNALTNPERTLYMLSPPAGAAQTRLALQTLAQLALLRNFSEADVDEERPIVIEEWRGGLGVAQRMNEQRRDSQRVGSRYVGHPPIGSRAAIEQATAAQLKAFHARLYAPNNMQLNIVGDIDVRTLKAEIEAAFANYPVQPLPERELDLPLMPGIKVFRLQDSESGSHRVSLMYRGHHAANRDDSLDGQRERLLDRLTTRMMLVQLQRQPLPEGVKAFGLQRTQIGTQSEILALSASLGASTHHDALRSLLTEVQRMRAFGLHQADLDRERDKLKEVARSMLARGDARDFTEWVKLLGDPSQADRNLQARSQIADNSLLILDSLTLSEINQRLRRWTDADDWVLQLSQPTGELQLPDAARVQQWHAEVSRQSLTPPLEPVAEPELASPPPLPQPQTFGTVTGIQRYPEANVAYWSLSNGDRLVWLKRPDPSGKAYLRIETGAGYQRPEREAWLEQVASQVVWNAPPEGFSAAQWNAWKTREGLSLHLDQGATKTTFKAEVDVDRLSELFALYRVRIGQPTVPEADLQQAREDLAPRISRTPSAREHSRAQLAELRYGPQPSGLPDREALNRLNAEAIHTAWAEQAAAPVTYYLLADVTEAELRDSVIQQLAGIERRPLLPGQALLQRPGIRHRQLHVSLEPRATVELLSYRELGWSPEDAVRVAHLKQFAGDALKARLRNDARGLYQLTFDSELNAANGRIETRLLFNCDPQRLDELKQMAMTVLEQLPQLIDEHAVQEMRSALKKAEQGRLADSETQLHRLALSDQRWGDPRYLSRQQKLPNALELSALREMAARLLSPENQVSLAVLPSGEAAQ